MNVFVPTTFIPDAFVDTELAISVGYSNSLGTDIPLTTSGGQQIGTVEGDLLFFRGIVEFNCALRDWIGFTTRFDGQARSGANTASIFASGVETVSGFGLGWEFRLSSTDRSMLAGSVSVDRTSVTLIDVAAFINSTQRELSRTFTPLLGTVGTRYAYSFSDLIKVSAYGDFGRGENPKEDYDDVWFWKLGGVTHFNLKQRYDVPLGIAVGARTSSYPVTFDNADGNSWSGLVSIAYMGMKDFSIQMDTVYEHVPIKDPDVSVGYVGVTLGVTCWF